jgi:hypothetical protein
VDRWEFEAGPAPERPRADGEETDIKKAQRALHEAGMRRLEEVRESVELMQAHENYKMQTLRASAIVTGQVQPASLDENGNALEDPILQGATPNPAQAEAEKWKAAGVHALTQAVIGGLNVLLLNNGFEAASDPAVQQWLAQFVAVGVAWAYNNRDKVYENLGAK